MDILVLGIALLIGTSIVLTATNELRLERAKDQIKSEMIGRYNDAVQREAELLQKITELEKQVKLLKLMRPENDIRTMLPPPPDLPLLPELNPQQQRIDYEKKHQEPIYKK